MLHKLCYLELAEISLSKIKNIKKYFFCHMPFGKKELYAKEVRQVSLERLYTSNKSLRLFDADESLPFLENT